MDTAFTMARFAPPGCKDCSLRQKMRPNYRQRNNPVVGASVMQFRPEAVMPGCKVAQELG